MLELSSENPEALIDFIDFILSLNLEDQVRLVNSLQKEYPLQYLVNLYIPLLESGPSTELMEALVMHLGDTRSPEAYMVLERMSRREDPPVSVKSLSKALTKLQLSGANASVLLDGPQEPHPLVKDTIPYQCFTTISDGIGNQGLIISRQRPNGDITMMSIALNDLHGIIDCFGFFQLSVGDFQKISEKFHEGATKIKVSPEYCLYKIQKTETLNYQNGFRLPYEYRCWRPLANSEESLSIADIQPPEDWIKETWFEETDNLYQHPDFRTWFLEQGDEPCVTRLLQKVVLLTEDYLITDTQEFKYYLEQLEKMGDSMVQELLETNWRNLMIQRLEEAAYLLHCQNTHTFRNLAATEAYKLKQHTEPEILLTGFTKAFGRRCIGEELLRLRTGSARYEQLSPLVDTVLDRWGF